MGDVLGTIIKLFVLCVVVGMLMAWFDIRPETMLTDFGQTVQDVYGWLVDSIRWAVPYAMLGAVIVLPVYGLTRINRFLAERKMKRKIEG